MCGHIDPLSQHLHGDYPELFAYLLRDTSIELIRYDLDEGRFPVSERECDGWICAPSRNSVYDNLEWIAEAEELHRRFIALELPYVGICFGHQLLAQALGGKVERASHGWNVGVHEYELTESPSWIGVGTRSVALVASHQDQVTIPPGDATVFAKATDGTCPIGGMVVGDRAWTIQLHPEFVPDLADHLLAGRVELIGASKVAAARASLSNPIDSAKVSGWISRFFDGH